MESVLGNLDTIRKPYAGALSAILNYKSTNDNLNISIKFFPHAKQLVSGIHLHASVCEMKMLQDNARELRLTVSNDATLTDGQRQFLYNAIDNTIVGYDLLLDAVHIEADK
ncbi:MAG: hypothetical protein H6766_04820 [Candidatus Peribacteria bacterium]|nr:MAG: hypothetical protein H6766_04820 [Candidatus Peribacteria bacterium]